MNNQTIKIYVFGNPLVKEDRLPLKILPKLKKKFSKIEFKIVDPNENFPPVGEKDLILLDTVEGLIKPKLYDLEDVKNLKMSPISTHDYDLGMHLLLLKKLKKINSVKIIGVPIKLDLKNYSNLLRIILTCIR